MAADSHHAESNREAEARQYEHMLQMTTHSASAKQAMSELLVREVSALTRVGEARERELADAVAPEPVIDESMTNMRDYQAQTGALQQS